MPATRSSTVAGPTGPSASAASPMTRPAPPSRAQAPPRLGRGPLDRSALTEFSAKIPANVASGIFAENSSRASPRRAIPDPFCLHTKVIWLSYANHTARFRQLTGRQPRVPHARTAGPRLPGNPRTPPMTQHPRLMSPLTLRGHTLRNRIVFGAHTANMSDQGLPGPRFAAYLLERALGGAAMIVAEPVPVHRTGVLTRGNFLHSTDEVIPHFRKRDRTRERRGRGHPPAALPHRRAWRFRPQLRPALVALRRAVLPRQRRQPCHDRGRGRGTARRPMSPPPSAPKGRGFRGSRSGPPTIR